MNYYAFRKRGWAWSATFQQYAPCNNFRQEGQNRNKISGLRLSAFGILAARMFSERWTEELQVRFCFQTTQTA